MIDFREGSALIRRCEWYLDMSRYFELTFLSSLCFGWGPGLSLPIEAYRYSNVSALGAWS